MLEWGQGRLCVSEEEEEEPQGPESKMAEQPSQDDFRSSPAANATASHRARTDEVASTYRNPFGG